MQRRKSRARATYLKGGRRPRGRENGARCKEECSLGKNNPTWTEEAEGRRRRDTKGAQYSDSTLTEGKSRGATQKESSLTRRMASQKGGACDGKKEIICLGSIGRREKANCHTSPQELAAEDVGKRKGRSEHSRRVEASQKRWGSNQYRETRQTGWRKRERREKTTTKEMLEPKPQLNLKYT